MSIINTTARTLKVLSAIVWYIGAVVLIIKGGSLVRDALAMKPDNLLPWVSVAAGLIMGGLKTRFIFSNSCRKNLDRIDALEYPKVWQFFSSVFFVALACMMTLGATLSRAAQGNYPFLISVATLDFSIAFALLGSSYVFWDSRDHRIRSR